MANRTLLFLGGSYFQLPPIFYARKKGHYIVVCDYLPDNPGRNYANAYYNISTTDLESILKLAKRLCIDGIIAYASDPAAATAAYVAEKLNLSGNPYRSVQILSQKDMYRNFLLENNFNTPFFESFTSIEAAEIFLKSIDTPVMLKPVDSSGSKGVCRIEKVSQLREAFKNALNFSRAKKVIIEKFIKRKGFQIAGDGLVVNGKLTFKYFGQEHFTHDKDHFVPIGESFPLQLPADIQNKIVEEINRLLSLLNMKTGALNFDILLDKNNDIYLMEVGPRAGGNLISEVTKFSTGIDMVSHIVDGALGLECKAIEAKEEFKCYSSYILHSNRAGLFKKVNFRSSIKKNVFKAHIFTKKGMPVMPFNNSGGSIGCVILRFDEPGEMLKKMNGITERIKVEVH